MRKFITLLVLITLGTMFNQAVAATDFKSASTLLDSQIFSTDFSDLQGGEQKKRETERSSKKRTKFVQTLATEQQKNLEDIQRTTMGRKSPAKKEK